jgi:hypothetical protein
MDVFRLRIELRCDPDLRKGDDMRSQHSVRGYTEGYKLLHAQQIDIKGNSSAAQVKHKIQDTTNDVLICLRRTENVTGSMYSLLDL